MDDSLRKNQAPPFFPLTSIPSQLHTAIVSAKPTRKEVSIVKMTVYIPEELHRELRHVSFDERRSATDIIRELVREYLAKKRGK